MFFDGHSDLAAEQDGRLVGAVSAEPGAARSSTGNAAASDRQ